MHPVFKGGRIGLYLLVWLPIAATLAALIAVAGRLGIRVAIVGDPKDHSTRALLETIRKGPHA